MSNYHLLSKADDDIDDIVDYTLETWGELQTHNYVTELFNFYSLFQIILTSVVALLNLRHL